MHTYSQILLLICESHDYHVKLDEGKSLAPWIAMELAAPTVRYDKKVEVSAYNVTVKNGIVWG